MDVIQSTTLFFPAVKHGTWQRSGRRRVLSCEPRRVLVLSGKPSIPCVISGYLVPHIFKKKHTSVHQLTSAVSRLNYHALDTKVECVTHPRKGLTNADLCPFMQISEILSIRYSSEFFEKNGGRKG